MNAGADAPDARISAAGHAWRRQRHPGKIEKESRRFFGESRRRERQVAASFNCHDHGWPACRDHDASDGGCSSRLRRAWRRFHTGSQSTLKRSIRTTTTSATTATTGRETRAREMWRVRRSIAIRSAAIVVSRFDRDSRSRLSKRRRRVHTPLSNFTNRRVKA